MIVRALMESGWLVAVHGFETGHLIFVVVLPNEIKREGISNICSTGEGIEDPNRLFSYLNLVGNRADKV